MLFGGKEAIACQHVACSPMVKRAAAAPRSRDRNVPNPAGRSPPVQTAPALRTAALRGAATSTGSRWPSSRSPRWGHDWPAPGPPPDRRGRPDGLDRVEVSTNIGSGQPVTHGGRESGNEGIGQSDGVADDTCWPSPSVRGRADGRGGVVVGREWQALAGGRWRFQKAPCACPPSTGRGAARPREHRCQKRMSAAPSTRRGFSAWWNRGW